MSPQELECQKRRFIEGEVNLLKTRCRARYANIAADDLPDAGSWWICFDGAITQVARGSSTAYQAGATSTHKNRFKNSIIEWMNAKDGMISEYEKSKVSDERHMQNIEKLSRYVSEEICQRYPDVLLPHDNRRCSSVNGQEHKQCNHDYLFRISSSQRLLNLRLKHLWSLGHLKHEPPHCPIDSFILRMAGINNVIWTTMNCIGCYKETIKLLKAGYPMDTGAGNDVSSLAEWELTRYNIGGGGG